MTRQVSLCSLWAGGYRARRRSKPWAGLGLLMLALGAPLGVAADEGVAAGVEAGARAGAVAPVLRAAQAQGDRAWTLLERLVNIDTPTGSVEGWQAASRVLGEALHTLGAEVDLPAASGPVLIGRWRGDGGARILLLGHVDTVFPAGAVASRPFRRDASRAYGPGVADAKGGLVVALAAVGALRELGWRGFGTISLMVNGEEETGSAGTRAAIEAAARAHDLVLNLEPGRPADGLVVARKGSGRLLVEVKGKAAHAGVAPETGRNAAVELAHQILQLGGLADPARQTTVNFTLLKAGTRSNVIPDEASAQADVRVVTAEEFDRVEREAAALAQRQRVAGTVVSTRLVRGFPPMPPLPRTDALARQAQALYGELGRRLTVEASGGASDASFTAGAGTPTLDGFGLVGGQFHTADEYAEQASMVPRIYLLARMLLATDASGTSPALA